MTEKTFKVCIRVKGDLQSAYVFENDKAAKDWVKFKLPKLEREYGKLKVIKEDLPGLKVGDKCNVYGEAYDVFTITDLITYSEDRYGFVLDSGYAEEVAKCHTEFIKKGYKNG
jgi:hypothetical protein